MHSGRSQSNEVSMAHLSRLIESSQRIRTSRSASGTGYQSRKHYQILPVVNAIPLTFRKSDARNIYPNEVLLPADVAGLQMDSVALCYQIRTLDKSRLEVDVSELVDAQLRREVVEALRFQLDM